MSTVWVSRRAAPRVLSEDDVTEAQLLECMEHPEVWESTAERLLVDLGSMTADDLPELQLLCERASETGCRVFGLYGGAGWLTLRQCLGLGLRLVTDPAFALPTRRVNAGELGVTVAGVDRREASELEYESLLATPSTRRLLEQLTDAVHALRRRTLLPLWDGTRPASPGDAPPLLAQPGGAGAVPSLRDLLRPRGSAVVNSFLSYVDTGREDWDPAGRDPRHPPAVLLEGETGTGKSMTAEILHSLVYPKDWRERPLVRVSAPTLGAARFSDELFGYTSSAYSNAGGEFPGHALQATRGTLFLDELGDLTPEAQRALLVFLDTRRATVAGLPGEHFLPLHVVAATNRPLNQMARQGTFRQDLLQRFGVRITLPTLRERLHAVPGELEALLAKLLTDPRINPVVMAGPRAGTPVVQGVHRDAVEVLRRRSFRNGNFREFRSAIERATASAQRWQDPVVLPLDLPEPGPDAVERMGVVPLAVSADEALQAWRSREPVPVVDASLAAGVYGVPVLSDPSGTALAVTASGLVLGAITAAPASPPNAQARLVVPEAAWPGLEVALEHGRLGSVSVGPPESVLVEDVYLDSGNRALRRQGISARVRQVTGSVPVFVLKRPAGSSDPFLAVRHETRAEDPLLSGGDVIGELRAAKHDAVASEVESLARLQRVIPVVRLRQRRRLFPAGSGVELALDEVELLADDGASVLASCLRAEVRTAEADAGAVERVLRELEVLGLRPDPDGKLGWALATIDG